MSLVCLDNGHGLDSGQVEDGQQGEEVFIKHYHPSSTKKRLSQRWRRICNARLVYGTSQEFASRGMRIPMVIAVVEGGGKNQGESFLLTSSVSHLPNVATLLSSQTEYRDHTQEISPHNPSPQSTTGWNLRQRRRLLADLAGEWRRLHEAGICYAESHIRHIYVEECHDERCSQDCRGRYGFVWIDHDGTHFVDQKVPRAWMITDFYRLYCSCVKSQDKGVWLRRSEMMRFLHDYSRGEWSKAEIKQVAREVLNWQPALYHRIAIPLRNAVRAVFRRENKAAGNS